MRILYDQRGSNVKKHMSPESIVPKQAVTAVNWHLAARPIGKPPSLLLLPVTVENYKKYLYLVTLALLILLRQSVTLLTLVFKNFLTTYSFAHTVHI